MHAKGMICEVAYKSNNSTFSGLHLSNVWPLFGFIALQMHTNTHCTHIHIHCTIVFNGDLLHRCIL